MHDCFAVELTDECLKCSFRLTRGGPYLRGVIGSTMGAYPRGTGSNPVEGSGHFFPSYRQLYLSSFSDTHTFFFSSVRLAVIATDQTGLFGAVEKVRRSLRNEECSFAGEGVSTVFASFKIKVICTFTTVCMHAALRGVPLQID